MQLEIMSAIAVLPLAVAQGADFATAAKIEEFLGVPHVTPMLTLWPVKRRVYDGPRAYSNLNVGRSGTPSQGRAFLVFEGGPGGFYEAVQVVSFNLSWLLNGKDVDVVSAKKP